MEKKNPLIIVITDEVGSTPRDEKFRESRDKEEIDQAQYKRELLGSRQFLFESQIKSLRQPENGWTIIKTVGDSLIISLKPCSTQDFTNDLKKCLGSLLNVWQNLEGKLRVACHLVYLEDIVTGENELGALRESLEKSAHNGITIAPILQSIVSDIFGSPMNRAARLASIPEHGLFVVSHEIMETMYSPEYLAEVLSNTMQLELELESFAVKLIVWAYAIPLVNVKGTEPFISEKKEKELKSEGYSKIGIESLKSYLMPWYVWELEIRQEEPLKETGRIKPLRVQFKGFQSLKVVTASFPGTLTPITQREACVSFAKRLQDNPCHLFVDFVFKVNSQYQLFPADILRDFPEIVARDITWRDVLSRSTDYQRLIPYYVMFTSVPDIKTNWKLRKYFAPQKEEWFFQHISYDVYESLIVADESTHFSKSKKYFLLLFQIRDDFVRYAEDWRRFFHGKNETGDLVEKSNILYPKYPLDHKDECYCSLFGLMRGEVDGFILFRSEADIKSLKDFLHRSILAKDSFFYKIAPIFLYELELMNLPGNNVEYLKLARRIYDEERYGQSLH